MKFLAFDIEIAKTLPDGASDWKAHRPLGITCAAVASSDGDLWNWWAHDGIGRFTPQMTESQSRAMVESLIMLSQDYTIVTWNGLGFDFDILAEESGMFAECRELALDHVDMMFHFFCSKGYRLGLDAAAKGMGLAGKPEGMDGALAPVLWEAEEYHKVLNYVSWDVKNTLNLALTVEEAGALAWTSKAGRPNAWHCNRWLTVREALGLPEPNTSWIDDPWPRSTFYEWLLKDGD